jgi:hypothetical protein
MNSARISQANKLFAVSRTRRTGEEEKNLYFEINFYNIRILNMFFIIGT